MKKSKRVNPSNLNRTHGCVVARDADLQSLLQQFEHLDACHQECMYSLPSTLLDAVAACLPACLPHSGRDPVRAGTQSHLRTVGSHWLLERHAADALAVVA